jgi:hypothetical protein
MEEPDGRDATELVPASASAAPYRAAAARARALRALTTTPSLKRYLEDIIARGEGRATEIES